LRLFLWRKRLHRYAAFNRAGGAVTGQKISVLFIDWEAQFSCTIAHCEKLRALYQDVIDTFYWVALPLTTQNALTQYKPQWQCWEPGTAGSASRRPGRLPTRAIFHFINPE
jgi:predicted phosphoadenosine phosphosulfate sulfurtransferase